MNSAAAFLFSWKASKPEHEKSAIIPVKKTVKDESSLHLPLLCAWNNGFKTYFGISDMICGIHLYGACKKLNKTKHKVLGISMLLLQIQEYHICMCENNPCT